MDEIRYGHWRDVAEAGDDKKKISASRWEIYINRELPVSVLHPKRGNIVWNSVKDNITEEKKEYEAIGLRGFDYKWFEKEGVWGLDMDYTGILISTI